MIDRINWLHSLDIQNNSEKKYVSAIEHQSTLTRFRYMYAYSLCRHLIKSSLPVSLQNDLNALLSGIGCLCRCFEINNVIYYLGRALTTWIQGYYAPIEINVQRFRGIRLNARGIKLCTAIGYIKKDADIVFRIKIRGFFWIPLNIESNRNNHRLRQFFLRILSIEV